MGQQTWAWYFYSIANLLFISPIQYPLMLILSILIVTTGLVWPHKSILSNIMDLLLSVDVMLLLILRSTGQLNDKLGAVTFEGANKSNQCVEFDFNLPILSYILLPFYYLPLLCCMTALCVWTFLWIR